MDSQTAGRVAHAGEPRGRTAWAKSPPRPAFADGYERRFYPPYELRVLQKLPHGIDEEIRLVVVHPMPRLLHHDDTGVAEMARTAVLLRIGGPALLAVHEERRARHVRP